MHFTTLFATVVASLTALAAAQSNPITSPTGGSISAGSPTTITWTPTDQGTITLVLRSGQTNALSSGTTIASGIPNSGSYSWTPDASTSSASDYTIEIISSASNSSPNYSPRFAISGSGSSSVSGSSSTSGSTTSSGSSSMSTTGSVTTSGNSTTTSSTMSTSTTTSNTTTTTTSSSTSSRSSSSSHSSSASSSASAAPSSGMAAGLKGSDAGFVGVVLGLAGLVAAI